MQIKSVAIVHNKSTDPKNILKHRVFGFFEDRNICTYDTDKLIVDPNNPLPELVVIIGGDGTFLKACQTWAKFGIPLVGINSGHLGFLTRIDGAKLEEYLEDILRDKIKIEKKLMLEVNSFDALALNDIVVKNTNSNKMAKINVKVDDEVLADYDADGLIVATPTGSTAYNLSASGPIIDPRTEVIAITPICPHSLSAKPIIIDPNIELTIESDLANNELLTVSIDGIDSIKMNPGDKIQIKKSKYKLPFVTFKTPSSSFYHLLKSKLGWNVNLRAIAYEARK